MEISNEQASVVASEMRDWIEAARQRPSKTNTDLTAALKRLEKAQANSPLDALALASVSKCMLEKILLNPEERNQESMVHIYRYLKRAVEALEETTGAKETDFVPDAYEDD